MEGLGSDWALRPLVAVSARLSTGTVCDVPGLPGLGYPYISVHLGLRTGQEIHLGLLRPRAMHYIEEVI
jgi:hypothetical protein